MSPRESAIEAAAEAHTNLTMFSAVVSLMEGGHLYGNSPQGAAARIIRICHAEQRKMLEKYDAATAQAMRS